MRIWSLHPQYLDAKGLVALWRETLLAQNVLLDKTKGYKHHPQLIRFKNHQQPLQAIANYLHDIVKEATRRNYNFNIDKITLPYDEQLNTLDVTDQQLYYEWQHLLNKLQTRTPQQFNAISSTKLTDLLTHPLFSIITGPIANWEIV